MKYNDLIRDKLRYARIETSAGTWEKVEKSLDDQLNRKTRLRRLYLELAGAAAIVMLAFYVGTNHSSVDSYQLETLEISSYQEANLPLESLHQKSMPRSYRKDGKLLPNYRLLWNRPLMPSERNL